MSVVILYTNEVYTQTKVNVGNSNTLSTGGGDQTRVVAQAELAAKELEQSNDEVLNNEP